ncbi:MAG: phytanoyl-CoA dioxygenase family protein [bacterium]
MRLENSDKQCFERDGYVIIRQALTPLAIEELRQCLTPLYENFTSLLGSKARDIGAHCASEIGYHQPEIDRPSRFVPALRQSQAMQTLQEIASDILGTSAKYTFDHSICKMPQSGTHTGWHQDQGYLGENIHLNSVNFWIPLVDVDENNGTLCFVPGSHKQELLPHKAMPGLHPHTRTLEKAPENAVAPILKLGDISIHHPYVIHGAGPNKSDQARLAWAVHFSRYGRMGYFLPRNLLAMGKRLFSGRFV